MVVSAYYSRMPTIRCQDCNAVVEWANEHTHVCGQDENPMPSHKFHRPPSSVYGMNQLNDGMKDMKVSRFEERSASKKKADPIQAFQQFKNKKSFDDSDDYHGYDDFKPTPYEEPRKRYEDRNPYEKDRNHDRNERRNQDQYDDRHQRDDRYQQRDDRYQQRDDRYQPADRYDDRYQPEPMRNNSFREKERFPQNDLQRNDSYKNNIQRNDSFKNDLQRNDSFKDDFQHDYSQPYFEPRKNASPVDEYDLICGDCKQPIYDTADAFEIEWYHVDCFRCEVCHIPFDDNFPYVPHEGKAFCEQHYADNFLSTCAACNKPITDGKISHAFGRVFHARHLRCNICKHRIRGPHVEHNGKAFCAEDYERLTQSNCARCQQPIDGNSVHACGGKFRVIPGVYHRDCFGCTTCYTPFPDKKFFVYEGQPYCLMHYHEASNTLCGACRNPIQGQCVDIRETNKRYHPDCWTCAVCRMRLTGVYFSFNGKQYCEADIDRVYKQGNGRHKPKLDQNLYRSKVLVKPFRARGVFGGHILALSIHAAAKTMDPKFHFQSAHCYFILAGDDQVPVVFNVINERTGTSYAKRIVRASQNGKTIFSLIASFAVPEQSQLEYQVKMPKVLFPHEFKCEMESGLAGDERSIMFHNSIRLPVEMDVKVIPTEYLIENSLPSNKLYYWMRSKADLPPDQLLHSLIAAYISDYEILNSSLAPYGLSKHGNKDRKALTMIVSLDHAIWLHQPFKADEWHLFELQNTRSNNGRAFCNAKVFNMRGELVMSTAQEGVIRIKLTEKQINQAKNARL